MAHGRSTRGSWSFELQPLEGRQLVSACLAGVTNGCIEPRLRELTGSGFAEANDLLAGLPELGWVNLRQAPRSPWLKLGQKTERAEDRCLSQPFFLGVRGLELLGHWPESTWAVLHELGEQSAMRTSAVYRWQNGHYREVFRTDRVGDFLEGVVPWRDGVAALEIQLLAAGPDRLRVLAFSGKGNTVLISLPNDSLSNAGLNRLGEALVLSGVRDDGQVELVAWAAPGAPQRHRVRSEHTYSGMTFDDTRATVIYQVGETGYEAVEVTFDRAWHEVSRRSLPERELDALTGVDEERLFPPALGISVDRGVTGHGHTWFSLRRGDPRGANGSESWLVTDRPSPSTWELGDDAPREPARPAYRPGCSPP